VPWMPPSRSLALFALLALSACPQSGPAPTAPQHEGDAADLRASIDAILDATSPHPFTGAVIVARGERVLHASTRGLADQRLVPIALDTQFVIGSLSKQMTAALVPLEAAAGRLDLHAPIARYLPELPDR
jgi:D-alanyl-D-alanine carboxypeptidase